MTTPSVLFISAFKDIGRGDWNLPKERTNGWYLYWFSFLARLPAKLILFCESEIAEHVESEYGFKKTYPYEAENTFFTRLERQRKILESPDFRKLVRDRDSPECHIPEYNVATHNKALFVQRAKNMFPEYTHYAWIDFGYFREEHFVPKALNFNSVKSNIEFSSFDLERDIPSPQENVTINHDPIQGSMFICPKDMVDWYAKEYTNMVDHFESLGIVDDDQAIVVQMYKKFPEKFTMTRKDDWFVLIKDYEVTD